MFPFYIFDWTIILLIPGIVVAAIAQSKVSSAYDAYSKVQSKNGVDAEDFAGVMLKQNGIDDVKIFSTRGALTDNYNPVKKTLNLSEGVFGRSSVAAISIAAHEAGHAVQHAKGYLPIKIRTAIAPIVSVISSLAFPLIIIGIFMSYTPIIDFACIAFFCMFVFHLVTLPVEFDASKRALANIEASHVLTAEEYTGAKKVLTAAALTYVAAALVSFLQFMRLFLISRRR